MRIILGLRLIVKQSIRIAERVREPVLANPPCKIREESTFCTRMAAQIIRSSLLRTGTVDLALLKGYILNRATPIGRKPQIPSTIITTII